MTLPPYAHWSALECAAALGIKYREGLIKNRYVGRTFIMPQQGLRRKSVRQKLAPIASELNGRAVLLVDDSIVRGTTSREIIAMAREAGATRVYMASAAPPVRYPNVYGIDMPTKDELVAGSTDTAVSDKGSAPEDPAVSPGEPEPQLAERVAAAIGADRVFYQDLPDLTASVLDEARACGAGDVLTSFDCSCFDGVYATAEAVGEEYLQKLAATRRSDRGGGPAASATHLLDRLEIPQKKPRVARGPAHRTTSEEGRAMSMCARVGAAPPLPWCVCVWVRVCVCVCVCVCVRAHGCAGAARASGRVWTAMARPQHGEWPRHAGTAHRSAADGAHDVLRAARVERQTPGAPN